MDDGWSDVAKQIPQANPQSSGNLLDVDQGQIPHTALDPAVIGPVKPAALCSHFLADSLLFPQAADRTAKADADVGRHRSLLSWLAVHPYTADESHLLWVLFVIRKDAALKTRPCNRYYSRCL